MEKEKYLYYLKATLLEQGESIIDAEEACKYAKNLIELDLPVIFDRGHLLKLLGVDWLDIDNYHDVSIPKKNGGERVISIPSPGLKRVQRWVLDNILGNMHVSQYAMGFCEGRSIVQNASYHVGKKCVINLDIKDFFPSINQKRVFRIFYYYGYSNEISYWLSKLCTYKNKLPQGSPTSPYISNIVCLKLDRRLSELAKRFNADYTRYADDITFSSKNDITAILPIVKDVLKEEGFEINEKKTRILFSHQKQEVTGLLVGGDKVHIEKKYIKKLKQEIYYCKKYGVVNHLKYTKCDKRFYRDHLYGKAYYVKMVNSIMGKRLIEELDKINWD